MTGTNARRQTIAIFSALENAVSLQVRFTGRYPRVVKVGLGRDKAEWPGNGGIGAGAAGLTHPAHSLPICPSVSPSTLTHSATPSPSVHHPLFIPSSSSLTLHVPRICRKRSSASGWKMELWWTMKSSSRMARPPG